MSHTNANPAVGDGRARQGELHFWRNVSAENSHSATTTQADTAPVAKSAAPHVSVALGPEESDTYPRVVARLNAQWRVICCRDGNQWILQSRCGQRDGLPRWRSRYFFRTRQGLVSGSHEYAGETGALVILLRLPERFPEGAP